MNARFERILTRIADKARAAGEKLIRVTDPTRDQVYFDPTCHPWVSTLEAHWQEIRSELDQVLVSQDRIPTFQEVSREQAAISDDELWKTYFLQVFGTPIGGNCQRCPRTAALLAGVPGLGNAVFSILLPGKRIPQHRGPYKGLLRYHLALRVPTPPERCWIEVNGERRHWVEGASLMFDDSFPHSAANESDGIRVVLFLDFPRPLPAPVALINRCVIWLLGVTEFARRPIAYLNQSAATTALPRGVID
jgi:ornithine lipid ester-linked acyl 2-hydroxylase